jgi:transcription elongation GreA/GreB family factor
MTTTLDRDAVQADLAEALEQADLADNGQYDKAEPRIWHCTAALRRLAEAVKKIAAVLP